jgi:hypothetical protein
MDAAEQTLGCPLPPSFRIWLEESNGTWLESVRIFPIYDARDPRTTWDSITRYYNNGQWVADRYEWLANKLVNSQLLPFAEPDGTADVYYFDLNTPVQDFEYPVMWLSHETGDLEFRASNFAEFVRSILAGEFED